MPIDEITERAEKIVKEKIFFTDKYINSELVVQVFADALTDERRLAQEAMVELGDQDWADYQAYQKAYQKNKPKENEMTYSGWLGQRRMAAAELARATAQFVSEGKECVKGVLPRQSFDRLASALVKWKKIQATQE